MKITCNNVDSVNAVLTIEIDKEDYAPKVKQGLKEFAKTAVIPGFRKGMTPPAIIRKMYGKAVLFDEITKLISNQLNDYIKENKLPLFGEPLPREENVQTFDLDSQDDYKFVFDLGLRPEINIDLTENDRLPYYIIAVDEEMIERQIENYKYRLGSHVQVECFENKGDMLKGILVELNEDNLPKENGLCKENSIMSPEYMKNEEEKNKFTAAKVNDTVIFNPFKAYEGNEVELSSFLDISKAEVNDYTGNFSFEIKEITVYREAEINQELFDKLYKQGTVTSEEQFKEKVKETIADELTRESDYRFMIDLRKLLNEKSQSIQLPEEFLKRWMTIKDDAKDWTDEDFPKMINDTKVFLVKNHLVNENNLTVAEDEIRQEAAKIASAQLNQYGINYIPPHLLNNYVQEMMKKEGTYENLESNLLDRKLSIALKEKVTLEQQEVSMDDFTKLFEQNKSDE